MSENIHISCGPAGGDCTAPYYVTLAKKMTVKEFIDEWIQNEREWGYFYVKEKDKGWWQYPSCEYRYGKIKKDDIEQYHDKVIKEVSGSGGWSRSDFTFTVRK